MSLIKVAALKVSWSNIANPRIPNSGHSLMDLAKKLKTEKQLSALEHNARSIIGTPAKYKNSELKRNIFSRTHAIGDKITKGGE